MATIVYGMNQSLDGYVDHLRFPSSPQPGLFREFIRQTEGLAGSLYGRNLYDSMVYWNEDHEEWDDAQRAFAAAWRKSHKWVVSRTLRQVGPNATLLGPDIESEVRRLREDVDGEIEVGGPELAHSLAKWGLIDQYRIYLHPVVLGHGKPFFAGPRPPLRLISSERFEGDVLRLIYVPA